MRSDLQTTCSEVCTELKVLYDDVANEPLPSQWDELADALDAALNRGELFGETAAKRS